MSCSKKEALSFILNAKELTKQSDGETVQGLCLIQNYNVCPQKNGGHYIGGQLQAKGSMQFKAWGNSDAFVQFSSTNYQNMIVNVSGSINEYNGVTSLIIDRVLPAPDGVVSALCPMDFMEEVYDADELLGKVKAIIKNKCSEAAFEVYNSIISNVEDKFKYEYAAISHHDNVKSGLVAHTLKVMRISSLLTMYPGLLKSVSADLLYLGCAFHDIGKIFEYDNGCISATGKKLSHHALGVKYLLTKEAIIVEKLGQDFFDSLLSIVEQHHGEYGESPRTLAAYVIHKFDVLDSILTSLENMVVASKDSMVLYDNFKLSF